MEQKLKKCICGFKGTDRKVQGHIMNRKRWHPEEKHGYVKENSEVKSK